MRDEPCIANKAFLFAFVPVYLYLCIMLFVYAKADVFIIIEEGNGFNQRSERSGPEMGQELLS